MLVNIGAVARRRIDVDRVLKRSPCSPGVFPDFPASTVFPFFYFATESPRVQRDRWYRLSMTEETPLWRDAINVREIVVSSREGGRRLPKRKNPTSAALYLVYSSLCKCQTIPDTPISRSGVKSTDYFVFYASDKPVPRGPLSVPGIPSAHSRITRHFFAGATCPVNGHLSCVSVRIRKLLQENLDYLK